MTATPSGAALRLRDQVAEVEERQDRTLLDARRPFEACAVDAAKQVLLQAHAIEIGDGGVVGCVPCKQK